MKALLLIALVLVVGVIVWKLVLPVWRSFSSSPLKVAEDRKEAARVRLEAAKAEAEAIKLEAEGERVIEEAFDNRLRRSNPNQ